MIKFKKILVPVDYSDYSRETLKRAAELAKGTGGEIVVLHVVEPIVPSTMYVTPMAGYADPYRDRMDDARAYLDSLHATLEGVTHEWFIRTGNPGEEILACAKDVGADLIVMATHGRSGLSRLLMGSTAEAVIHHATVPVMTYRAATLKTAQPVEVQHLGDAQPAVRMTPV